MAAFGADRGIARAFQAAMPWAASRGGCGPAGDGTVYAAIASQAEVVILGHSRARHDYDTTILRERLGTTVFNAGKNGQGLWYSRGIADLLARTYGPRILIIDIDPQAIVYHPRDHAAISFLAPHMDQSPVVHGLVLGQSSLEPAKYFSHRPFGGCKLHRASGSGLRRPETAFDPSGEACKDFGLVSRTEEHTIANRIRHSGVQDVSGNAVASRISPSAYS